MNFHFSATRTESLSFSSQPYARSRSYVSVESARIMNKICPLNSQTSTNEVVSLSGEWAHSFNGSAISYFSAWKETNTPAEFSLSSSVQNGRSSPEKEKEKPFRQDLTFQVECGEEICNSVLDELSAAVMGLDVAAVACGHHFY